MPPDPTKKSTTRIACTTYTASILRAELEKLGFDVQDEHATYLLVGATLGQAMELALRLRTATHVLWQLARFRCPSPKALYKEVAAYPWEKIIPLDPPDNYFTIRASSDTPTIDNQMYPALVAKDAVVDRFTKKFGRRPDAGPDRTGVVLNLYWKDDRAAIFLNINGRPLSDRGYRRLPHAAPMRETLAAAVLIAAGYDGTTPFLNPMCGSGTLAIEAALIATNRAPGLLRSDYAVLKTVLPVEDAWREARARVKAAGAVPVARVAEPGFPPSGPIPVARLAEPGLTPNGPVPVARLAEPGLTPSGPVPVARLAEPGLPSSGTGFQPVSPPPPIIASDHDPAALDAARKNAQAAGVERLIEFVKCDFRQTPIPDPRSATRAPTLGHIILNPEYGQRMGDADELEPTYAAIGDFFKQRCAGWTGHVFTGGPELAKHIGLRPARKRPFMNGSIECRLLSFDLYAGTRQTTAPRE